MGTNLRVLASASAIAVVGIVAMTTSAQSLPRSQKGEATPAAGGQEPAPIEIPETRIFSLSPDGTLLAVGRSADNQSRQLCVYEVATLTERTCGDLDSRQIESWMASVVWSPDSTKIAFAEPALLTRTDGDLWMMDAVTGEITNQTDDGSEGKMPVLGDDEAPSDEPIYIDVLPAWAPDSRSIAFSRSPIIDGESRGNQIVSIDLESGEIETVVSVTVEVTGVVYLGLTWTPDGQQLYYSVTYPDMEETQNGVWVYDRATGQTRQIVRNHPEKGPPVLIRIAATGTTGLVAYPYYLSQVAPESDGYALLDLQTYSLSPVNPGASDPSSPVLVRMVTFSPDGTRVLYGLHQLEDDRGRFLVRDLPDGETELAAEIDRPPFMMTIGGGLYWANDGTVFAATALSAGLLLHLDPGEASKMPEIEPVGSPGAESVASPVPPTAFAPGKTVTLTAEAPLRATPSDNGAVVLELRPGAALTVVGEPIEAGGSIWVPVIEPATGTIGYVDASLFQPAAEEGSA